MIIKLQRDKKNAVVSIIQVTVGFIAMYAKSLV